MSQKVQKYRNTNELSKTFGKYYVRPVYDKQFISTDGLAEYIQTQCTVKKSDIRAVLEELGSAMKHYFELGQKVKLEGIGIFKVGISSAASDTEAGCTASLVKKSRVNFQPETTAVLKGVVDVQRARMINGVATVAGLRPPRHHAPRHPLRAHCRRAGQRYAGREFRQRRQQRRRRRAEALKSPPPTPPQGRGGGEGWKVDGGWRNVKTME